MLNENYPDMTNRFFMEGDVIIPDAKPDVDNILFVDALPVVEDYIVNSGQITVTGNCEFNILYTSDLNPNEIYRISTSIPFKNSFDVKDLTPESNLNVRIIPTKTSSLILNGRKISVSAELDIKLNYSNPRMISYVDKIPDTSTINVISKQEDICNFVKSLKHNITVKDTIMLETNMPNIKDIIKYTTKITNEESTISDGKIMLKGDLQITIYYTSDQACEIHHVDATLPFTTFIDEKNLENNFYCDISTNIQTVSLKILADSDELMRIIEINAILQSKLDIFYNDSIPVIQDLYDTQSNLIPETQKVTCYFTNKPITEELPLRHSITIPEDESIKILTTFGRIKDIMLTTENEKNILSGNIDITILYQADNTIKNISFDLPIEHILSANITNIQTVLITNIEINEIEQDRFDVKISIKIIGKNNERKELTLITNITESETPLEIKTGIIIYFVKPNDTLWKIAKRFHTTIDKIVEMNKISNPDYIEAGKALIL